MQHDLAHMEEKPIKLEWEDSKSSTGKKMKYAVDAYWLGSTSVPRDGDTKQRDLILKMRELLAQYSM